MISRVILLFLLVVASMTVSAGERPLFSFVSETKTEASPALDFLEDKEAVQRYRAVSLHEAVKQSSGIGRGDVLLVELFDGRRLVAKISHAERLVNGAFTITAGMAGQPAGRLLLATTGERSLGTLMLPEEDLLYQIISEPNTLQHYLIELRISDMAHPYACHVPEKPTAGPADERERKRIQKTLEKHPPKEDEYATVDLLVAYTPQARDWAEQHGGGISNVVALSMASAQLTLENSETLLRARLVHARLVHYEEAGGNSNVDLRRFTASPDFNPWGSHWDGYEMPGHMDVVHEWRERYGADMCVILTGTGNVAGLAWQLTNRNGSPNYGFSLTRVQWAHSNHVFIHEVGHNMGCMHNRDQNQSAGPTNWFNWPENTWSSGGRWIGTDNNRYCGVMTYADGRFYSDGRTHTRVPYFSNPEVYHAGVPTGEVGLADNARTIRELRHIYAAYRPEAERLAIRQQFDLAHAGFGVATDGAHIYVSDRSSSLISQYDTEGKLLDRFTIGGVSHLYELAYDGQYFYGSDGSERIYQMDFSTQVLVSGIQTGIGQIRSLAYDAGRDGFWLGSDNPENFYLVNRQGETVESVANGSMLTEVGGIALDPLSLEEGVLWVYGSKESAPASNNYIAKIPLCTQAHHGGFSHDLQALLDRPGTAAGLSITPLLISGSWVALGLSADATVWVGEPLEFRIDEPQVFTAVARDHEAITLRLLSNSEEHEVIVVYSDSDDFEPPAESPPAVGEPFAGGTLLYQGPAATIAHDGLQPGQPVFYQAFSHTQKAYSPPRNASAMTAYNAVPPSITDADGNDYAIVQIGGQLWTRQNLRTTRFSNQDEIPRSTEVWTGNTPYHDVAPHTSSDASGIDSDEEMAAIYGLQYNWYAATDERGICPGHWRVPGLSDWTDLYEYLMEVHAGINESNLGNALKINRQIGSPLEGADTEEHPRWNEEPTHHANNASGLGLLPGGIRQTNGITYNIGTGAYLWEPSGETIYLRNFLGEVMQGSMDLNSGLHLRCIADFSGFNAHFTITDGEEPVPGAEVRIAEARHLSNEAGKTRFLLPQGSHYYDVLAQGFEPLEGIEFLLENEDRELEVVLTRSHYTITAGADDHGRIEPSGEVQVAPGADQVFSITADEGYRIASIRVNEHGINLGSDENWDAAEQSYTFADVRENHSIHVAFEIDDTSLPPDGISRLQVYPIPASGTVYVSLDDRFHGKEVRLLLYSLQGQLLQQHLVSADIPHDYALSVSHLPPGTYLLLLQGKNILAVSRLVVQ